jgi:hypothetical protein
MMSLVIMYNRCDPKVKFLEYGHLRTGIYKMSINNFYVGVLMNFAYGNIKPYGSVSLGASQFHLKKTDVNDSWRFSVAPAFGSKFFFNDVLGLRLQVRLFLPMEFTDEKIFVGSDTENSQNDFGIPVIQADLTAGLFVVIK